MRHIHCKNHHFLGMVDDEGVLIVKHRKRCITITGKGNVEIVCDRCGERVVLNLQKGMCQIEEG